MTNKSKNKGTSWEREICKFLSDLYGDSFTRVPFSGAYIGGSNTHRKANLSTNQTKMYKGDIVPPDNWSRLNVEAKNYAEFPFHRLLMNVPVPLLEDWLEQIMQAADPGDVNILFFKITRVGKFVAFETHQPFLTNRHLDYTDEQNRNWRLTEFDDFFSLNRDAFEKANIG